MVITITYMPAVLKTFRKQTLGNEKSVPNFVVADLLGSEWAKDRIESG